MSSMTAKEWAAFREENDAAAAKLARRGVAWADGLKNGSLKAEELEAIQQISQATAMSVDEVARAVDMLQAGMPQMTRAAEKLGEAIRDAAQKMFSPATVPAFDRSAPLERWTTAQLMTQLPPKAKELQPENLDLWQVLCLTQHILNNCPNIDKPSTYPEALQKLWAPELLKRVQAELEDRRKFAEFVSAWALVRMGAASLEELTPLFDKLAGIQFPETE